MYARPFYTIVSFVLFLIALTFPVSASHKDIANYNRWLVMLFEILPIDDAKKAFFALYKRPLFTRSEFVDFVFAMHSIVLKIELNRIETLLFFDQLRASDCGHNTVASYDSTSSSSNKEEGCRQKKRTREAVCCVYFHADADSGSFFLNNNLRVAKKRTREIYEDAMANTNAFCSCLFSCKWFLLHMVASNFPNEPSFDDKQLYKDWVLLFGELLACFACRVNFQNNVTAIGLDESEDFKSTLAFEMLIHRLHSKVNEMLHQKDIGFEDMKQIYATLQRDVHKDHFATIAITHKDIDKRFLNVLFEN